MPPSPAQPLKPRPPPLQSCVFCCVDLSLRKPSPALQLCLFSAAPTLQPSPTLCPAALALPCPGPGPGSCSGFCDLGELASNSQDSDLGATRFELGRVNDGECVRNRLYGIKYTENIKQIRHTTSEPLPCGPATTYLKKTHRASPKPSTPLNPRFKSIWCLYCLVCIRRPTARCSDVGFPDMVLAQVPALPALRHYVT